MPNTQAPGAAFKNDSKYMGSLVLISQSSANSTISADGPVLAGADSDPVDKNVLSIAGTIAMPAGDALHLCFAKSGSVTSPTFLIEYWRPIRGITGLISGFAPFQLCDSTSALTTFGIAVIGTNYNVMATANGLSPSTAIAGGEIWCNTITATANGTTVTASSVVNNMDLIKVSDDGPAILRITPFDGVSHVTVKTKAGSGGGSILCIGCTGRGLALNQF